MKHRYFIVSMVVMSLLAACASSEGGETGDDQEVKAKSVQIVAEGQICSPDAKNQRCASGTVCADNCPDGALCFVSIFTCQAKAPSGDPVIRQGGVCSADTPHCAPGLTCKDNCPAGALCIVKIETCQPSDTLARGAVCQTDASRCGPGLSCKDNCPKGAACFASIFTCQ